MGKSDPMATLARHLAGVVSSLELARSSLSDMHAQNTALKAEIAALRRKNKTLRTATILPPLPVPQGPTRKKWMADLIARVAEAHNLHPNAIIREDRRADISWARFEFYHLAHEAGFSDARIGHFCGDRDHTTVRSGRLKYEKERAGSEADARPAR